MAVEHTVTQENTEAMDFADSLLDTQGEVEAYGQKEQADEKAEATEGDAPEVDAADDEPDAGDETDGDSASDSDASEGDDNELRFVEIEINGTKYEVPEELKDGYLMQADYTRKTQSLADYRKEVELQSKQLETQQAEHQFIAEIQPEINNLGYLQAQIQQLETDLQTNMSTMPSDELFRKKIEIDGLQKNAAELKQQLESKYGEFQKTQEQAYTELLNKGAEILKQTIPDWTADKQKELREFALTSGFTEQEVNSIIDPRHVRMLWAASQYEKLQTAAPKAAEKVTTKVQAKARKPMPDATRRKLDNRKKIKSKNVDAETKANIIGEEAADWFFNSK